MIIDCRDCGPEWCAKHEPVTREVFCGERHRLTILSERHGWCARGSGKFFLFEIVPRGDRDAYYACDAQGLRRTDIRLEQKGESFNTLAELNDWFVANVINQEVEA